jgi:3-deoxy-manno-octulosonate cytidylyltransferase (CMP-KDO synthetase)
MLIGVIPARMDSKRFPGKPLALINGRPMIQYVYENSKNSKYLDDVIVTTCDSEIQQEAIKFGAKVIMTSSLHKRASERLIEVSDKIKGDVFVLIQGDEPLISGNMIDKSLSPIDLPGVECVNLMSRIQNTVDLQSLDTIKVIYDHNYDALYFSRSIIPYSSNINLMNENFYKQVCVIPFTLKALSIYKELGESSLERSESVDMLRFIENGYKIRMVETHDITHAVDRISDIRIVEKILNERNFNLN